MSKRRGSTRLLGPDLLSDALDGREQLKAGVAIVHDSASRERDGITVDVMTQALTIEEAAAEFGKRVSHIRAIALGRKMKGKPALAVPDRFEVRRSRIARQIGEMTVAMSRRELWGDDRLLLAIETGSPEP